MFKGYSANQKGALHILLLIGVIGVMAFLVFASSVPLRDTLLSRLYPKDSSYAAGAINSAMDFCVNGSNSSYPLDATLVSPGGNVQAALNTNKRVRLLPGNYESSGSKFVLS